MKSGFYNKCLLVLAICILSSPLTSVAYSVLTHEAIIDALWEKSIQPLLKQKYPGLTEDQLKEAHAYAYGGAIAPDMGYFPFGSHLFTNLVHYVRSGDMVNAILAEAQDVNEYAFALGFMCHYMADKYGHSLGTNQSVPLMYPRMKEKFGGNVTYDENNISHRRVEFAFDVLQTAKGNYASQSYHDFIGFKVSIPVLERAFSKTYGMELTDVCKNLSVAVDLFRWSVMSLLPVLTQTAWVIRKNDILKMQPTATSKNFRYKMTKANYYEAFGKKNRSPGFLAYALSGLIRILPKIGPLSVLKLKEPSLEAEKLFIQSFDTVLVNCSASMKVLSTENLDLKNIDFDTGKRTAPGEYKLADQNYGSLLLKLDKKKFDHLSAALKLNIIEFYSTSRSKIATRKGAREWKKITKALKQLKASEPTA